MDGPASSWRKASRSGSQSDCVEVANTLSALRDSKDPGGGMLAANGRFMLDVLVAVVKTGRLDHG